MNPMRRSAGAQPLQNRCDPFGQLHAVAARGLFMGNRGGRFHSKDRTLGKRRFVSRRWICCVCDFKGRQRTVWGDSYTELFFLDEVTALAAGHRPCFECRRADANDFASRFPADDTQPPGADMMDAILHRQRLPALQGVHQHAAIGSLPVGAMFAVGGKPYAVGQRGVLEWTFDGYLATDKRSDWQAGSHANLHPEMEADVLTPACIVTVLRNGYQPRWHKSAAP